MRKKSYSVAATGVLIVVLASIWGAHAYLDAASWRLFSGVLRGDKEVKALSYRITCPYHDDCIDIGFESPDDLSYIEYLFRNNQSGRSLPSGGILELSAQFDSGVSRRFIFVEYDGLWVAEYEYRESPSDRAYPTVFYATPPNNARWDRVLESIRIHHPTDGGPQKH